MVNYNLTQFAHDEAKAKSREFMLERLVATFPDRRDLKGVFLTGPSLAEYDQVYKRAGIPARNITGAERDKDAFAAVSEERSLRRGNDLISLYNGPVTDAFVEGEHLDFVSLDFDANYGPNVIKAVHALFDPNRRVLSDRAYLAVNMQASREASDYQTRLSLLSSLGMAAENRNSLALAKMNGMETGMPESFEALYEEVRKGRGSMLNWFMDLNLLNLRDYVLHIRHGFYEEVNALASYPLLRQSSADIRRGLVDRMKTQDPVGTEDFIQVAAKMPKSINFNNGSLDPLEVLWNMALLDTDAMVDFYNQAGKESKFKGHNFVPGNQRGYLHNTMLSWHIVDYDSFYYVSKSGTPMIMHSFGLEKPYSNKAFDELLDKRGEKVNAELDAFFSRLHNSKDPKYVTFRKHAERKLGTNYSFIDLIELTFSEVQGFRAANEFRNIIVNSSGYLLSVADRATELVKLEQEKEKGRQEGRRKQTDRLLGFDMQPLRDSALDGAQAFMHEMDMQIRSLADHPALNAMAVDTMKLDAANANLTNHPIIRSMLEGMEDKLKEETMTVIDVKPEDHGNLTGEEKDYVRKLYGEGYSTDDILSLFEDRPGISKRKIAAICAWKTIYAKKASDNEPVTA